MMKHKCDIGFAGDHLYAKCGQCGKEWHSLVEAKATGNEDCLNNRGQKTMDSPEQILRDIQEMYHNGEPAIGIMRAVMWRIDNLLYVEPKDE